MNVPNPVGVTTTFAFDEIAVYGPTPPKSGSAVTVSGVDCPGSSAMLARLDPRTIPVGFDVSATDAQFVAEPCWQIFSALPPRPTSVSMFSPRTLLSCNVASPLEFGVRMPLTRFETSPRIVGVSPPVAVTVSGYLPGSRIPIFTPPPVATLMPLGPATIAAAGVAVGVDVGVGVDCGAALLVGAADALPDGDADAPGAADAPPDGDADAPGTADAPPDGDADAPGAADAPPDGDAEAPGAADAPPDGDADACGDADGPLDGDAEA